MPDNTNELSQRLTALEKRVGLLEVEFNRVRSELNSKIDSNNSVLMDKIIELEKERVRLATILDGIQRHVIEMQSRPSFEIGFQQKVAQLAMFVASAAVGVIIVHIVERLAK